MDSACLDHRPTSRARCKWAPPLHFLRANAAHMQERYNDLPPLLPVYNQLSGRSCDGSTAPAAPGNFELHENTDYVDMGFYVQILSVALSNVTAYVAKERKVPRPRSSTSPASAGPETQQPETMLELVVAAIQGLHSRICRSSS